MPFTKGDKNINRQGRPVGSSQRVKELRSKILDLIEANFDNLQSEIQNLDHKDKFIVLDRLLKHCLPPPPPENLLDGFTDQDFDKIITYLRNKSNND